MNTTTILACGHLPTPDSGIGTGYATLPDGKQVCYPCADDSQRADMATATTFYAYISSTTDQRTGDGWGGPLAGHQITTWSGGKLGRVTGSSKRHRGYTPTGGQYDYHHVTVHAQGATWRGRTAGAGMYVRLHKVVN